MLDFFYTTYCFFVFFSYSADWWTLGSGAREAVTDEDRWFVCVCVCVCVVGEHVARVYVGGSAPGSVHP